MGEGDRARARAAVARPAGSVVTMRGKLSWLTRTGEGAHRHWSELGIHVEPLTQLQNGGSLAVGGGGEGMGVSSV